MTLEETPFDPDANRVNMIHRAFAAELHAGAGRTVDVRIVPYNTPAAVSDGGPVYREEWAEGAFDPQLVAGHRLNVLMNFEHERGIGGVIGKGVALRSQPDGLHGSFEMQETQDGDKALMLVRDGILAGVSLEALIKNSVRTPAGVVRRVSARLVNVALCRNPAFEDAVVLAVRQEPVFDKNLLPISMDPEVERLCRDIGMELPQRYQAHPDETDTPADPGTSEDGTRHANATTSSEGTRNERSNSAE